MPLAPLKEPWHQVARGANAADTENGKNSQVGVSPFDASKILNVMLDAFILI